MNEVEVGAYVRRFVAGIAERTAASGEGSITHADAIAGDKQACLDGAVAFRTDKLVQWIFTALPMYEKSADASKQDAIVNEAFAICVLLAYEAITFHSEHDYGDEALQDDLVGLADEFTTFLMGRPGKFEKQAAVVLRRSEGAHHG